MATQLQGTLLKSSIGVNNIRKSVMSFNKSIVSAQKTTVKINQSIAQSNRQKQRSISIASTNFQRRREAVRRREREDIVESSSVGGAIKRQGKVIASSTKGFLGRIMDFVGTVAVGWLLTNLPTIIRLGEQLIERGGKLLGVLRSFIANVTTILSGFGGLLVGTFRNLIGFDFTGQKQLIDNTLSTIQTGMIGIENDINSAITLLTTPLDLGFDQLDFDEGGAAPSAPEDVPSGAAGLPGAESPEMYRIAAALATEASGQQSIVDVMQVVVNRKATGKYGNTYTEILSAGTGGTNVAFEGVWKRPGGPKAFRQIQTLEDASRWSGQSKDSLLKIIRDIQNQTLQQSAAKHVKGALEFRGSPQNYGGKRLSGSAWRGGSNDNQFLLDSSQDPIRSEGAASFNLPTPVASYTPLPRSRVRDEINVSGPSGGTPSVGLSGGGGNYGSYRSSTRSHAGIDIGTSGQRGWLVGFKASGTVTYAGQGGGYGLLVIIKSGNTEYYFAHLARIFVKLGPYNGEVIGEIGNTGSGSGIHLHYEVRPNGRPIDPKPYLNLLDIGRKTVAPQTAANPATATGIQIASAKPASTQTATQVTPERKGQVVFLPMPETQVAQTPSPARSYVSGSALSPSSSDTSGLYTYIEQSQYFHLA
jgi:murein DD-endopeptidase MepM/ murein hydrolase activator NlpD